MIAATGALEVAGTVSLFCGATLALFAVVEKMTGVISRFIRRAVLDAINDPKGLVRYHLGPNGGNTPLYQRVVRLEDHAGVPHDSPDRNGEDAAGNQTRADDH